MDSAVRYKLISKRSLKRRVDSRVESQRQHSQFGLITNNQQPSSESINFTNTNVLTNENENDIAIASGSNDCYLNSPIIFSDINNSGGISEDFINYVWSDDDDEDSDIDTDNNLTWSEEIRKIAIQHNLTHCAVSDILKLLHKKGIKDVPKDARTLLSTPKATDLKVISPGHYVHFSLKQKLVQIISKFKIFTDPIKISRSSKGQFWPILAHLDDIKFEPFVIGCYYGDAKSNIANEFLKYFVDDLLELLKDGIVVDDKPFDHKNKQFRLRCSGTSLHKRC